MEPSVVWIVAATLLTVFVWAGAFWALAAMFRLRRSAAKLESVKEEIEEEAEPEVDWFEWGALILPSIVEFSLARLRAGTDVREVRMSEKRGNAFPWLLVGAGIGAALGLLFAPRKGVETRKQVQDWLEEEAEIGKDLLEKGQIAGRDLLEKGQERFTETKEQIVDAVKTRSNSLRNGKKTAAKA